MNRSGLTMLLGGDTRRINFDQCAGLRARRRCGWFSLSVRLIGSPRSQAGNNLGDFVSIAIEQVILTDERVLDFAGELEPLLARPRAEVAERTDRLLARPFRRHHGLDQHVVGVGLAVIGATGFADVHVAPRITRVSTCCTTNHNYCGTATDIFTIFSHYFEKIGEMTTATSAISMTSPDRVAAPPQNHREGTGSRASCHSFRGDHFGSDDNATRRAIL